MANHPPFAIRSSRVLLDTDIRPATLSIVGGKFDAVLSYDDDPGVPIHDVEHLLIVPGLVDTHVHINEPGRTEWEGFATATQAAAAGGITCVVDMPLNCKPVTTNAAALHRKLATLEGKLWIDCGFWGGVVPQSLNDLEALIQSGVLGVKSFTIHSGIDDFPKVSPQHLRRAMLTLAKYDLPYLIHAELAPNEESPAAIGDNYQSFLASRPKHWENDAINLIIELAKEARSAGSAARFHIVHLSSAEAISAIEQARADGLQITAESCPHYLTLYSETIPNGKTLFKCCPPIREHDNREQLWDGLDRGVIDFIVSDHSPCTPQLKQIDSGDLENAWGGISSLQFGLSLIWTEALSRGYNIAKVIDWMATKPAAFAGLGHRKGRIATGYDADFVVFDDVAYHTISTDEIRYRHKITPYAGHEVCGRVEQTWLRGQRVFHRGHFADAPHGRPIFSPLKRPTTEPMP